MLESKYFIIKKSKNDKREYLYKTLKNNLKCLIIYDEEADKCAAAMNVSIGGLLDPEEYMGLAHFLEHMLFMGTEKFPDENDFNDFLSKNSGESNAFTDYDTTNYHFVCSNESFLESLDKFAQFFISPLLNESSVEREMKAVDDEHQKNVRNDNDRFHEIVHSEVHPASPFKKFLTGNMKTLNKPKIIETLRKFHENYYNSNLMSLCVSSNIPLEKMDKIVDDLFNAVKQNSHTFDKIIKLYTPNNIYPYDPNHNNLSYLYKFSSIKDKDHVYFYWFVNENVNPLYKSAPLFYIINLLGHEGKNTLTNFLLKNEFIKELSASHSVVAHTFTKIQISIHLTNKGYENLNLVIKLVLFYIEKLKSLNLEKFFFEEYQKMNSLDFEFNEKQDPYDDVSDLCYNMPLYEPEDILSGPFLIEKFEEELIKKFLNSLSNENLNIYVSSKKFGNFESEEFKNEKVYEEIVYSTKFIKNKINFAKDFDLKDLESNLGNMNIFGILEFLGYPPRNSYVPQNFNIKFHETLENYEEIKLNYQYPQKIFEKANVSKIWYKPDCHFKFPKVYIYSQIYLTNKLKLNNNSILDLQHYEIYFTIWHDLVTYELNELVYMGDQAQLYFGMSSNLNGMTLQLGGYHDQIPYFTREVITQYKKCVDLHNNIENLKEKLLNKIDNRLKNLQNSYLSSPAAQVALKLDEFLYRPSTERESKIQILEEFKQEVLNNVNSNFYYFVQNFMKNSCFEWLVQGNITKEEVMEITFYIQQELQQESLPESDYNTVNIVKIPKETLYYHIFSSEDPKNENSSIASYYQFGYLTEKQTCMLLLIEQILQERFFDELRNEQQLGYLVGLSAKPARKIEGILCQVQSSTYSPEHVYNCFSQFFCDNDLSDPENLSDQDFKDYTNAVITDLKQKDINLVEEVERHFNEIKIREYIFNRPDLRIHIIQNEITKEDIVEFYDEFILTSPRRIDIELVSENHKKDNQKLLQENLKDEDMDVSGSAVNNCTRIKIDSLQQLEKVCDAFPDYYKLIK